MKLYFLRHGIAEDRSADGSDAGRRLTSEGIEEMHRVAAGIRTLDLELTVLLASPLVRARETAEIVARTLDVPGKLREEPLLASGCDVQAIAHAVEELAPKARVLLVGHEPDFSEAISDLIGGGSVRMKKASLACVDWPTRRVGGGELRWLLTADQLGKMAA